MDQADTKVEEDVFFDRIGGHDTFTQLIDRFFACVREDPVLARMYSHDWEGSHRRLLMFFEQYWGGPLTYSLTRGAPMLKMRHMPYKITEDAKNRWVSCMHRAIDAIDLSLDEEFLMRDYVERAATYLINADD